jgi:hypothetical protein
VVVGHGIPGGDARERCGIGAMPMECAKPTIATERLSGMLPKKIQRVTTHKRQQIRLVSPVIPADRRIWLY